MPPPEASQGTDDDQRREMRIRYDFPVFFGFMQGRRKPRNLVYQKGYTLDVSGIGLKILVPNPPRSVRETLFKDGGMVHLEIYLPAIFRSNPIVSRGEVRWAEPYGRLDRDVVIGVELHRLKPPNQEVLRRVAQTLRDAVDDLLGEDELLGHP